MPELCVDVLHHQCHCFTFDAFFHIGLDDSVVSDNVIPKTFGLQSFLPSLLLCGRRHHTRLLADLAKWILGVMTKLVRLATCFLLKVGCLSRSDVVGFTVMSYSLIHTFFLGTFCFCSNHCKETQQITIFLELSTVQNTTRAINNRHTAVYIQLNDSHIRTNEVRPTISRPNEAVSLFHTSDPNRKNSRSFLKNVWRERLV